MSEHVCARCGLDEGNACRCPLECPPAPMTAPLPSPEDVAQMRERHVSYPVIDAAPRRRCKACDTEAPCDAARLLALVDSQRAELAQVAARLVQVATYSEVHANMGQCPEGPLDRSLDPECRVCEWTHEAATGEGA